MFWSTVIRYPPTKNLHDAERYKIKSPPERAVMHASTQGRFPAGVRRLLTSSLCILSTSQPMRFESQPCGEVTN